MRRLLAPLLFLCAVSAQAQHPPASLSALVDAAWQREPRARLLDARRAELAALAEVAAGSLPGPGTVGLSHRNDRLQSDRGRLEWELEYAQPLWLPGQAAARRNEVAVALRALDAERQSLRRELARRLVDTRLAWLLATGLVHYAGDYCGIEDPSSLLSTVGPSATSIRNAVGLASANLDTQLNGTATTATAIKTKTDLLPTVAAGLSGGVLVGNGTGTVTLTSGGVVRANDANGAAIATATALATAQTSINTLATTTQLAASSAALLTQVNLAIATSAAILDDTGTSGVAVSAASKTGYKLAADGLDSISISDPGGIANYNTWPKYVVGLFRLMIGAKSEKSTAAGTIVSYADNGTTANLTMAYTSSGGIDTKGPAT